MVLSDPFSTYYAACLEGGYDCVDRIVLNGYFPLAQSPGGLRTWWRSLYGTDDNLDNTHLMRLAGRFSRRVRGWAKKQGIPVIDCERGDRKHDLAEQYLPVDPQCTGIFCVLVGRAPFPVWDVQRYGQGGINLRRKQPAPYVNHYSFHIWDTDWGHLTIKLCGHPPFSAQLLLNGHEFVARRAAHQAIAFTKAENCFTDLANAQDLQRVADTLRTPGAVGRLRQVCERWLSQCLCFALDSADQKRTGFRYALTVYQAEYSRNLLFERGRVLDQVFPGVIDRPRVPWDIKTIKTIFGCKQRPRQRSKTRWEVTTERPEYDLTVFKIHCGKLTLKMYTKGERVLRSEGIVHNARALPCGRSLLQFPDVVQHLQGILDRFLEVVQCADGASLADGTLERLPTPSQVGRSRVGGVDIHKPRTAAVMEAILAWAPRPEGFTAGDVAAQVRQRQGWSEEQYQARQASYDLKKLRGKELLRRRGKSHRYEAPADGLRTMVAVGVLRDQVLKPVLAGQWRTGRPPRNPSPVDQHYHNLRKEMRELCKTLRILP
jgi:hypothetical protein